MKERGERESDLYLQELVGVVASDRQGLGFNSKSRLPCDRDRLKLHQLAEVLFTLLT